MSKSCVKCLEFKDLSFFSLQTAKKDKRDSYCKICRNEISRQFYINHREDQIKRTKKYQSEHVEELQLHRKENIQKFNAYQASYARKRRKNDPLFKLKSSLRRNTSEIFRGKIHKRTLELLGCSFEEAKKHLESLFKCDMNWDNYGFYGWHIDHIIPLASAKTQEELEKLCHYTNLQPLWAKENLIKSDKMPLEGNL